MSRRFLRLAVLWFAAGVGLGAFMGATGNFMDKPLHVHANLLGWVSGAIFALVYRAWPAMERSRLAGVHFWGHWLGLAAMAAGLVLMVRGSAAAAPLIGAGSVSIALATVAFAVAVWRATTEPGRQASLAATPPVRSA